MSRWKNIYKSMNNKPATEMVYLDISEDILRMFQVIVEKNPKVFKSVDDVLRAVHYIGSQLLYDFYLGGCSFAEQDIDKLIRQWIEESKLDQDLS